MNDLTGAVCRVLYLFVPAFVANMAPVLVRGHFIAPAHPIDGGRTSGGIRVFGDHKTWRGLVAGIVAGAAVYAKQRVLHEIEPFRGLASIDYARWRLLPGILMGLGAGAGDALKSLVKRRIGIAPGESWIGFDQLDFFVGSYLAVAPIYSAPFVATIVATPVVFVGGILISAAGYSLHLKEAWI